MQTTRRASTHTQPPALREKRHTLNPAGPMPILIQTSPRREVRHLKPPACNNTFYKLQLLFRMTLRHVPNHDLFQNFRAPMEHQTKFSFSSGLSSSTSDPFLTCTQSLVLSPCTWRDPPSFWWGCISNAGMKSMLGAAGWEELGSKYGVSWREGAGCVHDFSTHFCKNFRLVQRVGKSRMTDDPFLLPLHFHCGYNSYWTCCKKAACSKPKEM